MTNTIELPWPSPELSPNARVHWTVKARAAKDARLEGRLLALSAKIIIPKGVPLQMILVFRPPNRRWHDLDNAETMIKNYIDGIFSASEADDHQIKRTIKDLDDPCPGGKVTITIRELLC